MRKAYGLDRPLYVQFFAWTGRALVGDFGQSYFFKDSVANLILKRLPITVTLGLVGLMAVYHVEVTLRLFLVPVVLLPVLAISERTVDSKLDTDSFIESRIFFSSFSHARGSRSRGESRAASSRAPRRARWAEIANSIR